MHAIEHPEYGHQRERTECLCHRGDPFVGLEFICFLRDHYREESVRWSRFYCDINPTLDTQETVVNEETNKSDILTIA